MRILVQASINLPGLRAMRYAWVDPERESEKMWIEAGYLLPVPEVPPRGAVRIEGESNAYD